MTQRNGVARRGAKVLPLRIKPREADALAGLKTPKRLNSFGRQALGQLVVEWRLERGLSQAELADDAAVSVEVVTLIERGDGMPPFHCLRTLAALMELSFEKLLRLVGLVAEEKGELHEAALRYLALTANTAPGTIEAVVEATRFRQLLRRDRDEV